MKIYVASSWRNIVQPAIVRILRAESHDVYDFRDPEDNGGTGFQWSDINPGWQGWSPEEYRIALEHPIAKAGFDRDLSAMKWADAFVLVMPCGRSAHLEAGWAMGEGKPTAIYLSDGEPELMYAMADRLIIGLKELLEWAAALRFQTKKGCPDREAGA